MLPIPTPFHSSQSVDRQALRSNIRKWNDTGISGFVVLGSTGERVNLDEREYLEVIEWARMEVPRAPDGLSFIVGAGQQSTQGTIKEIKEVAARGADAVLVITPHFYRRAISSQTLVAHYTDVADAASIPIILYSMPDLTGVRIEPETVAQLSSHPNIIGIKDSSTDLAAFRETVRLVPENFAVLTGNGTVLFEALRAGARGAILAVGCVVPGLAIEILRAAIVHDYQRAAALQQELTPLARAVTTEYGIGGLKAALDILGYYGGPVRAPLQMPDTSARRELECLLSAASVRTQNSLSHITAPG
jgi:4-hydroxy-tetrahydrodipicolinate synthase